jgi:hypothetical protein
MPSVLLALASACATGLGVKAVPSERPDYNRQIVRANDAELLLNLVRLRYNDAMLFPGVGGVVAQYAYDATLNAGGQAGGGTGSATFGTALAYGEKPTITYTPLVGEEAAAPSVRSSRRRPKARGQQLGTREIGLPCERSGQEKSLNDSVPLPDAREPFHGLPERFATAECHQCVAVVGTQDVAGSGTAHPDEAHDRWRAARGDRERGGARRRRPGDALPGG